ncbi:MAG: GntR family transcriptional regulator, partial [Planctomycetes bacterium]|nr:GntR family transcriptional regulator [Planctomycetota bacterium]
MTVLVSKTDFLYQDLRERIAQGEFGEGDCVPDGHQLKDKYGISRTVVRLSLGRLEEEGVINRRRGSGTFVAEGAREMIASSDGCVKKTTVAFIFGLYQSGNPVFMELLGAFADSAPAGVEAEVHFDPAPRFEHYFAKGADLVVIEGGLLEKYPVITAEYINRVIVLNSVSDIYSYICTDNFLGGQLMTRALIERGHRRIGVFHYGLKT